MVGNVSSAAQAVTWGSVRGSRGRCALAALLVATMALALLVPALAQAATVSFESGGAGTKVSTQFEGSGVYFTEAPADNIFLPEIATDLSRSPTRSLDITTGPPAEEFPYPGLEGRFPTVAEDVAIHVRNVTAASSTVTLTAYRSGSGTVTASSPVSAGAWTRIEVDNGGGESFYKFRVTAAAADQAKEIRLDDLEFTVDAAAPPDFQLISEESGGVALPGQPKELKVGVQRLNGFNKEVSFGGTVFGAGSVSFSPQKTSTSGSSTTVTMTLAPSAAEGVSNTLRIIGSAEGVSNKILDIPFVIESPFRVQAVDSLPLRADRCTTTEAAFRVVRNRFYSAPINLAVTPQSGLLPSDLSASVAPATILSLETVNPATVRVSRGDDPDTPGPVPMKIVASNAAGVTRSLNFDLERAEPRLSSVAPGTLFVPIALGAGTGVTVYGNGICPGATVQFGNDQAQVPGSPGPSPAAGDPTRMRIAAATPRLATDGQVRVVNPSGTVIGGPGLADVDARSYRDRFGFNFENEDGDWEDLNEDGKVDASDEPEPVGAGALRDWQELLGPRQTNFNGCEVGIFLPGCWEIITPIPTPQHLLMQTILGEASYYHRGGTCVGLTIASRRIASGQATVRNRPAGTGAVDPVWSLQRSGRETIPGRGDIPLEGQAQYSPIKYAAIQHTAQTTAEYLELWVERRSLNALTGPNAMRRALEADLRAGRRPLLNINWDGAGHAVNVYDIEDRSGGGFFIRVYDNNYPYGTSEAGNGALHKDREERLSRFEVTPGGSWTYAGLPVGKERVPRSGPTGDLSWISVENELPVVPSSLAHLDGLRALATPGLGSTVAAPSDPAKGAKSGVMAMGYLDGEGSIVTADSGKGHRLSVSPNGKGETTVGVFGEGAVAEVEVSQPGGARASGAAASAKGGGDEVILPKGDTDGIGFKAASGAAAVDLTLISDEDDRLVKVEGARGGTTELKMVGKSDRVQLTHTGRGGTVRIELAAYGRHDTTAKLTTTMRLAGGAKVTLLPRWKRLGDGLVALVNGKREVLRNHAQPPVRVKRIRVSAKQRGKSAVARVQARLGGKLGKLDALVVGVEIRRGKKVLGTAFRQLKPSRKSTRLLAKGLTLRPKLKSKGGRLTVRATVSALAADPLPSGDSRVTGARVR